MADGTPEVQRVSPPMMKDVASKLDITHLESVIETLRTEIAAIRADVIPVGNADLHTNRDFLDLLALFDEFKTKFGIEPKDMELDQNPQFAALENRVDVVEKIVVDLQTEITAIKALLNPNPTTPTP